MNSLLDDTDSRVRHFPGLSRIGALIADPGRAAMLWSLMDGTARPAGELTMIAGLSPSAASGHLARLTEGGLLALEVSGRHRYYRIAMPDIAAAIEALANLARASAPQRTPERPPSAVPVEMRFARTCYDHLAGELAVQLFDRMIARNWLAAADDRTQSQTQTQTHGPAALDTTPEGARAFAELGIDMKAQRARRRRFACTCIDWSERRPHLGGALGAAFLEACESHGWIEHTAKRRVLRVTPAGHRHFEDFLSARPVR
ncbi:transcriptional regulator, ArsR family [Burkholderia sp. YI23]|uniref:ArsR/SmtB family transcription factor n=1 Tax=unclassified Caballeronia TaxID=2646786 RepID=UPI0002387909|nr:MULTISPECIES: helix-turn-helix transcriptional regulator [unclassified Caballeronia]AET89785.1 transcriptional regulator, ArsR family [Burkholderia sp. YI23]MCE4541040.1 ArsR family transcriptional regulator [Caballeronia sp. PC1]MCE4569916.1 ArsR family transcriptional regulator [Caballeronia sp. CLC5]